MTVKRLLPAVVALLCALVSTGCGLGDEADAPLPAGNTWPRVCDDHISRLAVQRITGLEEPHIIVEFDFTAADGYGSGWCRIYEPDGEQRKLLEIVLTPEGVPEHVAEKLRSAARPLPPILPGAEGRYAATRTEGHPGAVAVLRRGRSTLIVDLEYGVEGRDHEADVVAMMKLAAPRLFTDKSAPASQPGESKGA